MRHSYCHVEVRVHRLNRKGRTSRLSPVNRDGAEAPRTAACADFFGLGKGFARRQLRGFYWPLYDNCIRLLPVDR